MSRKRFNVGTMLLLTDGSVLAQDSGTRHWWRLYPDAVGQYATGTWRQVATSPRAPLRFSSAVLADGRALVAGGELDNGRPDPHPSAEVYDPVADQWTDIATPTGWKAIGAAPICVLPDGKVLLGAVASNECALLDPATLTWSVTGMKNNANSRQEIWVLLPDGAVLAITSTQHPAAEVYAAGAWTAAGNVQPFLADPASAELGAGLLLTTGRVLALGSTNNSSMLDPATTTWTPGPTLPQDDSGVQLVAKNAPACLLPDGSVLCALGPVGGPEVSRQATVLFSIDRTGATFTRLPTQPSNVDQAPECGRMLVLPNGSVLFANGTSNVQIYESVGMPDSAWKPFLSDWLTEMVPGATARLAGTQLSGLSQAHAQGCRAANATNYPLVRLRATGTDPQTWFCRSFDHAPLGVSTGGSVQTTWFQIPEQIPIGSYLLAVIANGIASDERSVVVVPGPGSGGRLPSSRELDLQYELFWRDLNEVHLLMDYVSGHADKSLAQLVDVPNPDDPKNKLDPEAVVQEICKIRFPPLEGAITRARQASLLLTTKDRLNLLAAPASGMTVAYTSMFSGISLAVQPRRWSGGRFRKVSGTASDPRQTYAFATESYPNLKNHAENFRYWFSWMPWMVFVWAALTATVYWDVALSNAALSSVIAIEAKEADLVAGEHDVVLTHSLCSQILGVAFETEPHFDSPRQPDSDHSALPQTAREPEKPSNQGEPGAQAQSDQQPASQKPDLQKACWTFRDLEQRLQSARMDLAAFTEKPLWNHVVGWYMYAYTAQTQDVLDPHEQMLGVVISVFTNYIVPMMFGLLGAFAGVIRAIWAKV
jgi:hypothetical protein